MRLTMKQIISVFLAGIVLGVLGALAFTPMASGHRWANPEKFRHHMMDRFTSELGLTADQQQKVSVILEQARQKVETLREEVHPKFLEIRTASKAQIRQLLTPVQQKKFEEMNAKMKDRFKKRQGKECLPPMPM